MVARAHDVVHEKHGLQAEDTTSASCATTPTETNRSLDGGCCRREGVAKSLNCDEIILRRLSAARRRGLPCCQSFVKLRIGVAWRVTAYVAIAVIVGFTSWASIVTCHPCTHVAHAHQRGTVTIAVLVATLLSPCFSIASDPQDGNRLAMSDCQAN